MFVDPTIGNITIFAGNFAPLDYQFCAGQPLAINSYAALYAIIGTMYGGDGVTTFNLPDMRNRVVVHVGQGTGLSLYTEGQTGGASSVTLLSSNLPVHTHTFTSFTSQWPVTSANASQASPVNAVPASIPSDGLYSSAPNNNLAPSVSNGLTVSTGGSTPVPLQSPYLAMYYIIAVFGIFPSRN